MSAPLGTLVVQNLAVVVLIVVLPRLAAGSGATLPDLAVVLAKTFAFVAGTLFLGARSTAQRQSHTVIRLRKSKLGGGETVDMAHDAAYIGWHAAPRKRLRRERAKRTQQGGTA